MKHAILALSLFASLNVFADGICENGDRSLFQCNINGSLQEVNLCFSGKTKSYYISELDMVGDTTAVPLTLTQIKNWTQKGVLKWRCSPMDLKTGTCFTIENQNGDITYKLQDMGTVNNGYCN